MSKLIKKEEPNIIYASDGAHNKKNKITYEDVVPESITLELKREKAKRGGKFVIIIANLPNNPEYCKKLTKILKQSCACGGTFKNATIEVQGDKFDQVSVELTKLGFKVKKIGG